MKTLIGAKLDNYSTLHIEQNNLRIDPLQLPVEIKQKALKECKQDAILADAWLRGFAFCLEGQVDVQVQLHCESPNADWVVRDKEPL